MIHVYCDGSVQPGTRRAGIGVVATVAHDRAVCWAARVGCATSMQCELAAAKSALAWLQPATSAVLVVDNAATANALAKQPKLFAHLTVCYIVVQHRATSWPMQRAHALALGCADVAEHTVQRRAMPRACIVIRPTAPHASD